MKVKLAPNGVSMNAALAADGEVADTLAAAAAAAANAGNAAGDDANQDPDQTAPDGPGSKRNSFSNPLDLLAGLASEHHDKDGSDEEAASGQEKASASTTSTPKKKRKLLLPVKPVGAKVADNFKVIGSAVSDVPAASSKNFVIRNNDVLSGRGGGTNVHPGNILFRSLVKAKQADYVRAGRHEKAYIARDIVGIMRKLNPPARFLKKDPSDPDKWIEIDDKEARQKASQALREGAPKVRSQIQAALSQPAQAMGATAIPNPALPLPVHTGAVPPVPVANPTLVVRGAPATSTPVPVSVPIPGTVPPGSAPVAAAAVTNAITPLILSPASSTATTAPEAVSGSKHPQASVASASESEAKKQ